ncbi:adenosine deaminase [Nitriliruptoria bacterium AS10]|nr:adenosine deaminase [Salsipaludibacter albus]MBY5164032.1 adenosine deaminase [Salsipaludibacter albus]
MPEFVRSLPKAELHLHVEGTLEPELLVRLAERNDVDLPWSSVDEVRSAYDFVDLQSFLDVYYAGMAVLRTPDDYAELMTAYLDRAVADGVVRAEIFFDPQAHVERGVGFPGFMEGFRAAMADARRVHGITSELVLCVLRHLSGEDALATVEAAEPHLDGVVAIGLDSAEVDNPPERFVDAFARARELGLRAVAHAGEEGPPSFITGALDELGAERIDHGVRCLEDTDLVARLRRDRVPLTVCPLSNVALRVVDTLADHPLPRLLAEDLVVTINSDDPSYFGGYVGDNLVAVAETFDLDRDVLVELAANSITASFLEDDVKQIHLADLDARP